MPVQRTLTYTFLALLVLLQYPLWLGKGGWLRVWEIDRQVTAQKLITDNLKRRNAGMDAEVRDLKNGVGAVEERARYELGMVRDDELFFQVLDAAAPMPTVGTVMPSAQTGAGAPATAGVNASATPAPRP
ncbi:MAG: Septum formation initiator [Betaproteobacteria bacterium]|nr:Septum formation initiator [Betaproteobacteria bacterium]